MATSSGDARSLLGLHSEDPEDPGTLQITERIERETQNQLTGYLQVLPWGKFITDAAVVLGFTMVLPMVFQVLWMVPMRKIETYDPKWKMVWDSPIVQRVREYHAMNDDTVYNPTFCFFACALALLIKLKPLGGWSCRGKTEHIKTKGSLGMLLGKSASDRKRRHNHDGWYKASFGIAFLLLAWCACLYFSGKTRLLFMGVFCVILMMRAIVPASALEAPVGDSSLEAAEAAKTKSFIVELTDMLSSLLKALPNMAVLIGYRHYWSTVDTHKITKEEYDNLKDKAGDKAPKFPKPIAVTQAVETLNETEKDPDTADVPPDVFRKGYCVIEVKETTTYILLYQTGKWEQVRQELNLEPKEADHFKVTEDCDGTEPPSSSWSRSFTFCIWICLIFLCWWTVFYFAYDVKTLFSQCRKTCQVLYGLNATAGPSGEPPGHIYKTDYFCSTNRFPTDAPWKNPWNASSKQSETPQEITIWERLPKNDQQKPDHDRCSPDDLELIKASNHHSITLRVNKSFYAMCANTGLLRPSEEKWSRFFDQFTFCPDTWEERFRPWGSRSFEIAQQKIADDDFVCAGWAGNPGYEGTGEPHFTPKVANYYQYMASDICHDVMASHDTSTVGDQTLQQHRLLVAWFLQLIHTLKLQNDLYVGPLFAMVVSALMCSALIIERRKRLRVRRALNEFEVVNDFNEDCRAKDLTPKRYSAYRMYRSRACKYSRVLPALGPGQYIASILFAFGHVCTPLLVRQACLGNMVPSQWIDIRVHIISCFMCFLVYSIFFLRFWDVYNKQTLNVGRILEFDRLWRFPGSELQDDGLDEDDSLIGSKAQSVLMDFRKPMPKEVLSACLDAWAKERQYLQLDMTDKRISLELHLSILVILFIFYEFGALLAVAISIDWDAMIKLDFQALSAVRSAPEVYCGIWDSLFYLPAMFQSILLSRRINSYFDRHFVQISCLEKHVGIMWYNPSFKANLKEEYEKHHPVTDPKPEPVRTESLKDFYHDGVNVELLAQQEVIRSVNALIKETDQTQMLFGVKLDKTEVQKLAAAASSVVLSIWLVAAKSLSQKV
jgi:hypothetical protein